MKNLLSFLKLFCINKKDESLLTLKHSWRFILMGVAGFVLVSCVICIITDINIWESKILGYILWGALILCLGNEIKFNLTLALRRIKYRNVCYLKKEEFKKIILHAKNPMEK